MNGLTSHYTWYTGKKATFCINVQSWNKEDGTEHPFLFTGDNFFGLFLWNQYIFKAKYIFNLVHAYMKQCFMRQLD